MDNTIFLNLEYTNDFTLKITFFNFDDMNIFQK